MILLHEKNSNLAYLMEFTLARIEKLRSNATRNEKYELKSFVCIEKNSILAYLQLEFTLARIEK